MWYKSVKNVETEESKGLVTEFKEGSQWRKSWEEKSIEAIALNTCM